MLFVLLEINYQMKPIILFSFLLLVHDFCFSQNEVTIKRSIDAYLQQVQKLNQIPGLAVAVVKGGRVIYEGYYGKSSLETNAVVDKHTLFSIFSTTKLVSTVGVFQLLEKGQLSLEDKISTYIDSLPPAWKEVKIKNLLTHSSGLPDVVRFEDIPFTLPDREKLQRLAQKPMQFETGHQFGYNQTNYWLLTMIIEKLTGQTFDDYILKNQFPSAKAGVVFSSNRSEVIMNRASRYDFNAKLKKYERNTSNNGTRAHSGNGLNLTLSELIRWNDDLDRNILLKTETRAIMWSPFSFKNKTSSFLHGWGQYPVNKIRSYGFSGGNVTAFRKFVNNDLSIIFLSNGYRYFSVQDEVINHIVGIVDERLMDSYLLAEEQLTTDFLTLPYQKAFDKYQVLKKSNPQWNFENRLNSIGYILLRENQLKAAIKVFELNTKENPGSGDAFDSLGEGYFTLGRYKISKKHYQKSLELTPQNQNAREMMIKIEKILSER